MKYIPQQSTSRSTVLALRLVALPAACLVSYGLSGHELCVSWNWAGRGAQ